jgi:hypothetical protein
VVGAIVIVVLMLAIGVPLVLAPGLLQGVERAPRPAMTLEPGMWDAGRLELRVTAVASPAIEASLLGFKIENSTRSVYFAGPSGSFRNSSGVNTTVVYREADGDGAAGVGDSLVISVSPVSAVEKLSGCTLRVLLGADVQATVAIP